MGGPPPPPPEPVFTDVPFIQCAACKAMTKRAYFTMTKMKENRKKVPLTEEAILTQLSQLCDFQVVQGEWLHSYDMVEKGRAVELKKMNTPGVCGVECATIGYACKTAMNEVDDRLAEALYEIGALGKVKSSKELEGEVCTHWIEELDGACGKPAPLTPEDRPVGESFTVKPKPFVEPPGSELPKKKKKKGKKGKKVAAKVEL